VNRAVFYRAEWVMADLKRVDCLVEYYSTRIIRIDIKGKQTLAQEFFV